MPSHAGPKKSRLRNEEHFEWAHVQSWIFNVYIFFQTSNIKALYKLTGRGRLHLDLSHSVKV